MIIAKQGPPLVMEVITDPEEIARSRARQAKWVRNWECLQANLHKIGPGLPGKTVCFAGGEIFVGDTVHEVVAKAQAAHPDDDGRILHYIPKHKGIRIYAHSRPLDAV